VDLAGAPVTKPESCHVVTATGNPDAVVRTAGEAGVEVVSHHAYRDHHWFTDGEARDELRRAAAGHATLLLTSKDAVRWPSTFTRADACVLQVQWEWALAGDLAEQRIFGGVHGDSTT
jgi:tetraacyldisaccharide-1-P 4'-kinase